MATTAVGTRRSPYQALEKFPDAVFVTDDKKLYFGNDGDVSLEYDEDGNDVLALAGADVRISDTQQLQYGDGADVKVWYNPTSDVLMLRGFPACLSDANPHVSDALFLVSDVKGTTSWILALSAGA